MRLIALALLGATISCHAMTSFGTPVQTVMAQNAPFPRYHTFSFGLAGQPPAGYDVSTPSLEAGRRARGLIADALARKGYVEDGSKPDFVVRLSSGTREVLPIAIEGETDGVSGEEATVTIDMFDAATGSQVWHGSASAGVEQLRVDDAILQRGVRGVFADFPAQSSTSTASALAATATPLVGIAPERQ